jgi:hypothetical protein
MPESSATKAASYTTPWTPSPAAHWRSGQLSGRGVFFLSEQGMKAPDLAQKTLEKCHLVGEHCDSGH